MRILYVDVYSHGINPSNTHFPYLINKVGDVTFFGPSFVSEKTIENGIIKFIDESDKFDFLIIGPNTNIFSKVNNIDQHLNALSKYFSFSGLKKIIRKYYNDILENLSKIPIKNKIYSMFLIDQYGLNREHVNVLKKNDFYLLSPNENFFPFIEKLPSWVKKEEFYKRKKHIFDNDWKIFLQQNKRKVINCLHYAVDSEFILRDLSCREFDITVPGIMYAKRLEIKRLLKKKNLKIYNHNLPRIIRLLTHLRVPIFSKFSFLNLYNISFRNSLINSKFVFTEGGGFNAPVRKFFEITASGCFLLCRKPHSFEDLGFINKFNYLEVNDKTILKNIDYYKKNIDEAQEIAKRGFENTYKNHSLHSRSNQIKNCLKRIKEKKFKGSFWKNGQYIIE